MNQIADRSVTLDLEMFVWDPAIIAGGNPAKYFTLIKNLPKFLKKLRTSKIEISAALQAEIYSGIKPSLELHMSGDFRNEVTSFLGLLKPCSNSYKNEICDLEVKPDVIKKHFSNSTKEEILGMFCKIYRTGTGHFTFFSFEAIWFKDEDEIDIRESGGDATKVEVVLADDEDILDEYFNRKMNIFDENYEKHFVKEGYITVDGRKVSALSCYKGRNIPKCQELLDQAIEEKDRLYYKDEDNDVWGVFRRSFGGEPNYRGNNVYHGHDEDVLTNIPTHIRNSK